MATTKLFTAWLKDAYGMESNQIHLLEHYLRHYQDIPEVKKNLQQHLELSEIQKQEIRQLLEQRGERPSLAKRILGNVSSMVTGMGTGLFRDERLKDMLVLHANEHFAHICYKSLAAAAKELGEQQVANICEGYAEKEKAFAEWLENYISKATVTALRTA